MHEAPRKLIAALIFLTLVLPGVAEAAPTLPTPPSAAASPGGQGLEISRPVIEVSAKPGETITLSIRLRNVTKGDLIVNGQADDFGAKGENGEPQLLLDETESTRYSLKYWVQSVPSFRLAPQEVKIAQVQLVLPANAEPGGHYGVIRFSGIPPELSGTGVSLSASIGTLVLLKVSGNITEKLEIKDFYASRSGKRARFFESGPLVLTERIHNTGSVHEKPDGNITVKSMFGSTVAKLSLSSPTRNVLPDSIRKFEQKLNKKLLFGRFTAQLSATYASGKTLSGSTTFWVIPWKLLIVILLILVGLYFGSRRGIRRYNQYVIKQARRR